MMRRLVRLRRPHLALHYTHALFVASLGSSQLVGVPELSLSNAPAASATSGTETDAVLIPVAPTASAVSFSGTAHTPSKQNTLKPTSWTNDQESHVKVLLARAQYAIFTLGYNITNGDYALYCATTNELVQMRKDLIWKAAFWLEERIGDEYIAGIIFPCDGSSQLKECADLLKEKSRKRTVLAPDAWGIAYLAFKNQGEFIRGLDLPLGLEHAAFLLTRTAYDPSVSEPSVFDFATGSYAAAASDCACTAGAARDALVCWCVLFNVHKKFGTMGNRKVMNPIDQIVRRVVKAVNVFVVDINVRVGKGTIAEGFTMIVTIYDAQKRMQSVHMIRSLSEETTKRNTLNGLLYGEGTSSISLFVPTVGTKSGQLLAFARSCRPSCPFFVAEVSSLSPFFMGAKVAAGLDEEKDPRATWATIRSNCFPSASHRKDEDILDRKLQQGFTALANKLFSERLHRVSPTLLSAVGNIPPQENPVTALVRIQELTDEEKKNPVPHVTQSAFLNNININDAEVVFGLQKWRSNIYENTDRFTREQNAVDSLKRYLILDLETTTVRRYKRIANPFTKENFVVLSGARDYQGKVFMPSRYFDRRTALQYDDVGVTGACNLVEGSSKYSLFLPSLENYDVIVGHNIKFDLLHIWRDNELRRFLKRGGKIWDTMYAEYLLTGHVVKIGRGAGLEDVAKSYGGQIPKLDAVKKAWADGKETYQIPYPTLSEYLHGDLENTELIFQKHMERALTQRQAIIISARMDGLLCTTEMEYNGLKTNVQLAISQSNELVGKVTELRKHLDEAIPSEIPPDCRKYFNWSSNQHLITFFFGGKLKLNTSARDSKQLPGEVFDRHTLFTPPGEYPQDRFPKGVFLRPPLYVVGPADCLIVTGGTLEKGTKVFKTYWESYMKLAGFRKSSTMADSLCRDMVSVSRKNIDQRSEPEALVNLLPRRHLFFLASAVPTSDGLIGKLFLKNAVTGESLTILVDHKNKVAMLRDFLEQQVISHTDILLPAEEESDPSSYSVAFVDAHVTILARDAPFSFTRLLESDNDIRLFLAEHAVPAVSKDVDLKQRYIVTLADTVSIVSYCRHMYGSATEAALRSRKSIDESRLVFPVRAYPTVGNSKNATAESFKKKLIEEASIKPEEWCNYYIDLLGAMGHAVIQDDATASEGAPKKKSRKPKNKDTTKSTENLPIMLRERRAFVGYYNLLSPPERKRLALMSLIGRTLASPYDAFAVQCSHDDVVEVQIRGRLSTYVQSQLDAEQVMQKFRSSTTRQLQVGEDSLTYFKKTHNDKTADTILELRAMEKLIGTYYENTDGGTGMVSLVHSIDSCIHHELIHNKTNTGRLASANPNCQNIPKEDKSPLREMFVSRYGERGMCIEADYSQLEVVALAVLANDHQMLDDLRNCVDFHSKRVTMMRPDLKYTEVLLRAKKNKEPEFVKLRQQAKIFSFQRQYGAGVKMISQSTGLTQDQVRTLIDKERETYRGVDVFNNMVALSANNFDASLQDGARNVRGHQFFKGMFPVTTGSRYIFTESDVPEGMLRDKSLLTKSTNFSPTHLKNYPVQGFAGEIVQVMLGLLWRHFLQNDNYNGLALLNNTVHDCVWIDCHADIYIQVADDVEKIMSSVREVLNRLYPEMEVSVDFPCDVVAGVNMGALHPIEREEVL